MYTLFHFTVDYPLCKAAKHIRDLIKATLKSYSDEMLRKFFDYCVQEKACDLGKGMCLKTRPFL